MTQTVSSCSLRSPMETHRTWTPSVFMETCEHDRLQVWRGNVSAALFRLYWSVWGFPRDRRKHPHWTSEEGNNWLVYVIFISNSRVFDFMWLDQIEHIKAHSDRNFVTDGGFNKRHKTPVLDQFPRGRRWTLTTLQTAANNRIDQSLPKNTPQGSMSPSRTLELS